MRSLKNFHIFLSINEGERSRTTLKVPEIIKERIMQSYNLDEKCGLHLSTFDHSTCTRAALIFNEL